jgi:ubiquinol oxidase
MAANKTVAKSMTMFFRFFADVFFAKRYGHRAVVLETIAGVPGMVAGMLVHLRSLRGLQSGNGTMIHEMLAEAENERKHLMFFIELVHPNWFERFLIVCAQFIFWHFYLVMYILFPKTAHLMVHYFEEEAVTSYTNYLDLIENGQIEDVPAPEIAIKYYGMLDDAKLSDMIKYIRRDEQGHADVNYKYSQE